MLLNSENHSALMLYDQLSPHLLCRWQITHLNHGLNTYNNINRQVQYFEGKTYFTEDSKSSDKCI